MTTSSSSLQTESFGIFAARPDLYPLTMTSPFHTAYGSIPRLSISTSAIATLMSHGGSNHLPSPKSLTGEAVVTTTTVRNSANAVNVTGRMIFFMLFSFVFFLSENYTIIICPLALSAEILYHSR